MCIAQQANHVLGKQEQFTASCIVARDTKFLEALETAEQWKKVSSYLEPLETFEE